MTCQAFCCQDLDIRLEDLFFPERMSEDGRDFVKVHGLEFEELGALREGAQVMPSGLVRIRHRCDQLTDDGRCRIYDARPQICRSFDCATKNECTDPKVIQVRSVI